MNIKNQSNYLNECVTEKRLRIIALIFYFCEEGFRRTDQCHNE